MSPSTAKLAALQAAALAWAGTPWCPGAGVRGAGVCCHRLVAGVLIDAGWLPTSIPVPEGPAAWSKAQSTSIMEAWLDASAHFRAAAAPWQPGDVLGCRLGRCVHHLALALEGGAVIHAIQDAGAVIAPSLPHQWLSRVERVWRPVIN